MGDDAFAHHYHFGILVNVLGKRFVDEAADFRRYTYARLGREVFAQPRSIAFQIFDSKVTHLLGDPYKNAGNVTAGSLAELASKLDIDDKESLLTTIEDFNAAVQEGELNPGILDAQETEGIDPAKSNWALDRYPAVRFLSGSLRHYHEPWRPEDKPQRSGPRH